MSHPVFIHPLRVEPGAIDFNQHANNVQFVQWLQDVAMLHSAAGGWPLERYQQTGTSWVVRSHFVEYLRPAPLGDELLLATWIAGFAGDTAPRRTLIWRVRDRKLLARAEQWRPWRAYAALHLWASDTVVLKAIETTYPEYSSPPPGDDARENETSWTYFKKKVPPTTPRK